MIKKLDILKETNVIGQEIYDYVVKTIDRLTAHGINTDTASPAEAFLTHLAMAAARQNCSATPPIARMDEFISQELAADPNYARAQKIWNELESLSPTPFREEELDYFYLHLCTMLADVL